MFDWLFSSGMISFWSVLIVVFLIIEGVTVGITSIWFALGAVAALIAAIFNAQIWLQVVWFFVVSILALVLTRPLVKRFINSKVEPTNADMAIGMEGVVSEPIDNMAGSGAVSLSGKVWTARSESGVKIQTGASVIVRRIEGVKLIVSPVAEDTNNTISE